LPASAVSGGIFLVWADIVARVILLPSEIPVGIITAFLGAPFFMYLLRKRRHDFRF
jgi:iron complex transport system permease protein